MLSGIRSFSPLIRAVFVIGAVAALVSGITFAALHDTATLAGSTMSTNNAELQIYNFTTSAWAESAPGFAFNNLIPGTFSSTNSFYLKNAGGVNMNVTARVPIQPTATSGDFSDNWSDVKVTITGEACGLGSVVNTDMAALVAGEVALPCNPLVAGATGHSGIPGTAGNYNIKVKIDADAVTGSEAVVISSFDIRFTGTQVIEAEPL